jgi:hypothetical protein
MTKDDIDKLWNKAMGDAIENGEEFTRHRFAALIVANLDPKSLMSWQEGYEAGVVTEREACAKECEHTSLRTGSEWMAAHCAAAIRARGNT